MSMIPAFSPGPCTTSLLRVGSRFKCTRDDLYEQCSLHITLKMPNSVNDGSRPREALIFSYSSGVMPCSAMTLGVMAEACVVGINLFLFSHLQEFSILWICTLIWHRLSCLCFQTIVERKGALACGHPASRDTSASPVAHRVFRVWRALQRYHPKLA